MSAVGRRSPALALGRALAVAFYVAFALFPLCWLLKVAVTPDRLIFTEGTRLWPTAATWDNCRAVLGSDFAVFFRNSVAVSLSTAAVTAVIAAGGGYALSRFRFRGKRWVVALLLLTQMFPLLMIIAPIYRVVAALGLLDTLTSLVVVYTAFNVPFATFLMQSFFDGIPRDLEEAALVDGCTRAQALRKVVLPLTLPGLGATLGFVFTAAWSEIVFALMLLRDDDR